MGGVGGVGDRLERPVETHSIFVVFYLNVLLLFLTVHRGGGGNYSYSLFH